MIIFEAVNNEFEERVKAERLPDGAVGITYNTVDTCENVIVLGDADAQCLALSIIGTDWKLIAELFAVGKTEEANRLYQLATADEIHYVDYEGNFMVHKKADSPYTRLKGDTIFECRDDGEVVGEFTAYLSKKEIIDVIQGHRVRD